MRIKHRSGVNFGMTVARWMV